MVVYCFDNDKSTETLIKSVIPANEMQNVEFHFNDKISAIHSAPGSDTIAFIDTRIHGKRQNGFSLAMLLREKLKDCHIVFMSLYPEDMALCFKNLIRPSGFLLKPLSKSEVSAIYYAVDAHIKRHNRSRTFVISTHDYKRCIELDKIAYFSTSSKKLFCRLNNNERIEFYGTITDLEKKFGDDFTRCHSGFLVNKQYIKAVRRNEMELLDCTETIPISKRYKPLIMDNFEIV
ncbi:MAG: response regulator transcription factor [Ruminococcaceae bacterium]|nr:response regulator transcription factor [Oscillospiraceae bacterium]